MTPNATNTEWTVKIKAGIKFTEMEPVYGDMYGQIAISLNPASPDTRSLDEIIGQTHAVGDVETHDECVVEQLVDVAEGVDTVQAGGLHQRHEQVPRLGPDEAAVEAGVLAVPDGGLQQAFADVVRQRGAWEQCRELLASIAPHEIRLANAAGQELGNGP